MGHCILVVWIALFVIGCAGTYRPHRSLTSPYYPSVPPDNTNMGGRYHTVRKGQTLWRIAKLYHVNIHTLARINTIKNVRNLEVGQLIFIPETQATAPTTANMTKKKHIRTEKQFILPVNGSVTSHFGQRKNGTKNKGVDIIAPYGTLVVAAKSGLVGYSNTHMRGLGKMIMVDHQDGYITVYSHLSRLLVKQGDSVQQGQGIGHIGTSGHTKKPVLHFEIRKNAQPVNPKTLLNSL